MQAVQAHDRPRRLADDGVPHARRHAVLRRHLLPAGRPPRACRASRALLAGDRRRLPLAAGRGGASPASKLARGRCARASASGARTARSARTSSRAPIRALARSSTSAAAASGGARSFPQPMTWDFLLRYGKRTGDPRALEMVRITLDRMARGGMYDQLGGGFHRYSVDAQWLVPHFEKMLYDNAQLASLYLHAWLATGDPDVPPGARGDARLRPARDDRIPPAASTRPRTPTPRATRASSSSGRPTRSAACSAPTRWPRRRCAYWGVSDGPNFEGQSILFVPRAPTTSRQSSGSARTGSPSSSRGRGSGCTRPATSACTRAATTRCWPPGTAWRCSALRRGRPRAGAARLRGRGGATRPSSSRRP